MSWAVGYDNHWRRDIGYGVPALCDHPSCTSRIDRGLSYVCGGDAYGGDIGCGLFFCSRHLLLATKRASNGEMETNFFCPRCVSRRPPYKHPKPDVPEWMRHKLRDPSWMDWRNENPQAVADIRAALRRLAETRRAG